MERGTVPAIFQRLIGSDPADMASIRSGRRESLPGNVRLGSLCKREEQHDLGQSRSNLALESMIHLHRL